MQKPTGQLESADAATAAQLLAARLRSELTQLAIAWQQAAPSALPIQAQHAALLSALADDIEHGSTSAPALLAHGLSGIFDIYHMVQALQALRQLLTTLDIPQQHIAMTQALAHAQVDALLLITAQSSQARLHSLAATYQPVLGHDIKSPLAAISMSVSFLARIVQDPKQSAAIARIQRGCADLGSIVRNLYDFTHQHLLHGLQISIAEADLLPICETVIAQQQKLHTEVSFTLDCEHALPGPYDAERVRQLLGNIIHFLAGDEVRHIWLSLHAPAGHAYLSIKADQPVAQHDHLQALFKHDDTAHIDGHRLTPSQQLQFRLIQDMVKLHAGEIRIATLPSISSTIQISLNAPFAD